MKFFYDLHTIDKAGRKSTATTEFEETPVIAGRGAGSKITFPGEILAYEHLKFYEKNNDLAVEDISPFSNLRVNGVTVHEKVLKEGDTIQIGTITLEVEKRQGVWGVSHVRRQKELEEADAQLNEKVQRLNVKKQMPSLYLLSTLFGLLIVGILYAPSYFGMEEQLLAPGSMSRAHQFIADDCRVCHAVYFERIGDKQCLSCHNLEDHGNLRNVAHDEPSCISCHTEHEGMTTPITALDQRHCTDCHAKLPDLYSDTIFRKVPSFASHPEFRVSGETDPETGEIPRIPLSDSEKARDPGTIKFNHAVHLEADLKAPDGPTQLDCNSCHHFTDDMTSLKAIEFDRDCRECHPLGFDPRIPEVEVPHTQTDIVFNYMVSQYSLIYLRDEEDTSTPAEFQLRRKPGFDPEATTAKHSDFTRRNIMSDAREAERELFTRTGCDLCHEISERESVVDTVSQYDVAKPRMPDDWFPFASFDHGSHDEMTCESCHEGVRESEKAEAVLLPGVENCQQCHLEQKKAGYVPTSCMTCHVYHQSKPIEMDKKTPLEEMLDRFHGAGELN